MNYWLFKSEPDVFSIFHLQQMPDQTSFWDGVRNYQARNFLRDQVQKGDLVFFYHSSCEAPGIYGLASVVESATPDPTQFDPKSIYYDAKSTKEIPRWFGVKIKFIEIFSTPILLSTLKQHPALLDMIVCQKGSRLSINPVEYKHAQVLLSTTFKLSSGVPSI